MDLFLQVLRADEKGQRIHSRTVTDRFGTKKTYLYDSRGSLIAVSSEDPYGKLLEKASFSFDLSMNTSEKVHFRLIDGKEQEEQQTLFSHDSMGRPLTIERKGGKKGAQKRRLSITNAAS